MIVFVLTVFFEIVLRLWTFGELSGSLGGSGFAIAVFMSAFFACLLDLASRFMSGRAEKNLKTGIIIFLVILYSSQIVYYDIFRTFYTAYSMANGGQVLEFIRIIIDTIIDKIVPISLNFIGGGMAVFAARKLTDIRRSESKKTGERLCRKPGRNRPNRAAAIGSAAFMCTCLIASAMIVEMGSHEMGTPYEYYHKTNEIKGNVKSFGLLSAEILDIKRMAFGFNEVPENRAIAEMDGYFKSQKESPKNQMTGIFKGKNLIYITAESFTDLAIDKEHTPTLYKMSREGVSFENYYNPVWGVSTLDGEYVNCLGLIPKAGIWSMTESSDNRLPYALGNQFRKLGYVTKAYHNHDINFYHRKKSHPNLGYDFDGQGGGYDFKDSWPESDLEMINQTTEAFLTPGEDGKIQPFHVYYLTVSGHMEYNFRYQEISMKHEKEVSDLNLSEAPRAYKAANMELDLAMELLIERLDEAGVLEDTVIVIAGDHYPYNLSNDELSQLRGHEIEEPYEKFKSTAIIWTPDMEPVTVTKTASNLDLLPTISNLFGLEYDSRLLMGRDIFGGEPGLVVFEDKDWISDRGTRRELASSEAASDIEYVNETDSRVSDMFKYSAWILDCDYYRSSKLS